MLTPIFSPKKSLFHLVLLTLAIACRCYSDPVITVSQTSLYFGSQVPGSTAGPQTITLLNSGRFSPTITVIGDFAQTNNCGTPTVAAGRGCTINASFTPTGVGARTGSLTITDNETGGSQVVSLSGIGNGPLVVISPDRLVFHNQVTGTTTAPQVVTITNHGNAPLSITSITVSGDFSQTNNCGTTLAVGSTCSITVTYLARVPEVRHGAVTITDNAAGGQQGINLVGSPTQ